MSYQDFLAGWVGGISVLTVCHPFDTVKVRLQGASFDTRNFAEVHNPKGASAAHLPPCPISNYSSTMTEVKAMFKKEGVRSFYRGVAAPVAGVGIATAAQFGVYGNVSASLSRFRFGQYDDGLTLKDHLQNVNDLSVFDKVIAATCGGVAYATAIAPFEFVKIRLQTQPLFEHRRYFGAVDCARKLVKEGGTRKLYRGLTVTVLRDVVGSTIYFGSYGIIRQQLPQRTNGTNICGALFAGGCAGVAQWLVVFPLDTIKTRHQIAKEGMYIDWVHAARCLHRKEGIRAFYYGLPPALVRAFVGNAVCFAGVEAALIGLGGHDLSAEGFQ